MLTPSVKADAEAYGRTHEGHFIGHLHQPSRASVLIQRTCSRPQSKLTPRCMGAHAKGTSCRALASAIESLPRAAVACAKWNLPRAYPGNPRSKLAPPQESPAPPPRLSAGSILVTLLRACRAKDLAQCSSCWTFSRRIVISHQFRADDVVEAESEFSIRECRTLLHHPPVNIRNVLRARGGRTVQTSFWEVNRGFPSARPREHRLLCHLPPSLRSQAPGF